MLKRLLGQSSLVTRIRGAWQRDADVALKPLRKEIRRLSREVEALHAELRDTSIRAARGDRYASQLRLREEIDARQQDQLASLPTLLDESRIGRHISQAIGSATMHTDPFEHIVVEHVLPPEVYELVLAAMPPEVFFDDHDPIKRNLVLPIIFGPALARHVWNFVDGTVAARLIRPAIVAKFHEPLQQHYDTVFGSPFRAQANAMPHVSGSGRLMLRRRGYHLPPHRDPKRSLLTCLLYLARPGDSETHGTQLFRVLDDREASYKQTYYPGADGARCELVTVVPFRPNTMLVFLNSRGAHGATIPADAGESVERYSYQFYVAPENAALGTLIRRLPPERRVMWQNKNRLAGAPSEQGPGWSAAR
jgi:hypothetical protein